MTYIPPLCSEREPDGSFEDCTWASGVMLGNSATFGDYPNTRAEYEALRAASGDVDGGSSIFDLQRGMDARWGWHGTIHSFWTAIAALPRSTSFVLQGRYSSLPLHFRRWDRMFKGGHATHVVRLDDGTYWWQDPLATKGYPGEQMLLGTLKRFYEGLAGARAMSVVVGERALPDTGTDPVVIVDRWPFPAPRVATGASVTGYLPSGEAMTAPWPAGGLVSATATVTRDDNAAPKGAGWLVGASRPFTGYLVAASSLVVTVPAEPPPDCGTAIASHDEAKRAQMHAAVDEVYP